MNTITIKNIGSIIEVTELAIKRINVFMGPQSSGKSTIAKIISQALWAEKNFLTMGEEYDFYRGLISFHNMDKTYFNLDSEIIYESTWCTIRMCYEKGKRIPLTTYKKKKVNDLYHNSKIEYIPAERNFVASIANIRKYTENYNSTVCFLGDWYAAKAKYQRNNHFEIELPDLSFSYRYKESEERDILRIANGKEVELKSSSSGQQSLLPLLLVAHEVMRGTYESQKIFSPVEIAHIKRKASKELVAIVDLLSTMSKKARTKEIEKELNKLWEKIGYKGDYGKTHLVIEEPEQNLYPSTQSGLLERLVAFVSDDKRHEHTLTLTTHSPFILYALNNCMIAGGLTSQKAKQYLLTKKIVSIAPQDVGLWLMQKGRVISLQDATTHLLASDLFNEHLQENLGTMFELLQLTEFPDEEVSRKTSK